MAAVHVLADKGKVQGFYTLSASSLTLDEIPEKLRLGLPKYAKLPVFILGRLAVDRDSHGTGVGTFLLEDALTRCLAHSKDIKAIGVIVEAKSENAAGFYQRHLFEQMSDKKWFIATKQIELAYERNLDHSLNKDLSQSQPKVVPLQAEEMARVALFTMGAYAEKNLRVNEMQFFTDLATLHKQNVEAHLKAGGTRIPAINAFNIYEQASKMDPSSLAEASQALAAIQKSVNSSLPHTDQPQDLEKALKRIESTFAAAKEIHENTLENTKDNSPGLER